MVVTWAGVEEAGVEEAGVDVVVVVAPATMVVGGKLLPIMLTGVVKEPVGGAVVAVEAAEATEAGADDAPPAEAA